MPLQGEKKRITCQTVSSVGFLWKIRKNPSKSNSDIFAGEYILHSHAAPKFLSLS